MPLTANTMRILLFICLLGMSLLAAFYLRSRRLTFQEYIGWGLLIVLVPLLGPFLVLLAAPGKPTVRP
jgi:hypothetical protein